MHAFGHAFLAAAAGVLARALAGGPTPMTAGSTAILRTVGLDDPILGLAILGVLAAIAKLVGGALAASAEARVAGDVASELRLEVLDHVLGVERLRGPRHGDHGVTALPALTTHVAEVERGISHGVFVEARSLVQLVPLGALLVVLAPRLAGSAALALGAFGILAFSLRRAFRRAHARAAASASALVAASDEAVRHAELWMTYGAGGKIRAHVASIGVAIARESARLRARAAILSGTSEVLGALALALTLALVGAGAIGGVDRGVVVPFAIAFFMTYRPLRDFVDARLQRARAEAALDLATTGMRKLKEHDPHLEPVRHSIEWPIEAISIEGLVTAKGKHPPLDARIPAGSIAVIVGPTGIGKTTLFRVLLGLETALAGYVRYGSTSLEGRGVGPEERPFAWVPQEAPIVADTLAANVALGAPEGGDASARALLDRLGAPHLAEALGDQTLVTTRPVSGGERQWIAVARALATELPVLLLDEPTSALDSDAEARILAAIERLRGSRTVLLVTHRPAPLAIADVVVRLSVEAVAASELPPVSITTRAS